MFGRATRNRLAGLGLRPGASDGVRDRRVSERVGLRHPLGRTGLVLDIPQQLVGCRDRIDHRLAGGCQCFPQPIHLAARRLALFGQQAQRLAIGVDIRLGPVPRDGDPTRRGGARHRRRDRRGWVVADTAWVGGDIKRLLRLPPRQVSWERCRNNAAELASAAFDHGDTLCQRNEVGPGAQHLSPILNRLRDGLVAARQNRAVEQAGIGPVHRGDVGAGVLGNKAAVVLQGQVDIAVGRPQLGQQVGETGGDVLLGQVDVVAVAQAGARVWDHLEQAGRAAGGIDQRLGR